MKKRLLMLIPLIAVLLSGMVVPALAGTGETQPSLRVGDTKPLETGEEAVVIGFDTHGNAIWQVQLGEPVYLPGTDTKFITQWVREPETDNTTAIYVAQANTFTAMVRDGKVSIWYEEKQSEWTPDVKVNKVKLKAKKAEPVLLAVDPINPNYTNNTIMWDYGNGITRYVRLIEGMLLEYYEIAYPLNADFVIESKITKDEGFVWHRPPEAFDADNNLMELDYDPYTHTVTLTNENSKKVKAKEVDKDTKKLKNKDAKYPIIIDPDSSFTSTASDGVLFEPIWDFPFYGTANAAWTAMKAFNAPEIVSSGGSTLGVELATWESVAYYTGFLKTGLFINTSGLPDGVTITAATLDLYGVGSPKTEIGAWTLTIASGAPTYPHDPLVLTDFLRANYSAGGSGGTLASASMGSGYKTLTLNATGRGWIDDAGTTKIYITDNAYDLAGATPTYTGGEHPWISYNKWVFYAYEQGEGYRPILTVTYSVAPPEIQADNASNIGKTTARLNATVLDDGYESCDVRWGYGTTSKTPAQFATYDTVTAWSDTIWDTGEHPFEDIDTLPSGTTHYYRVQIRNSDSTVTSVNEINFETETSLDPPELLRARPSQTLIDLSWVRGDGSSQVMVRYKASSYPTTTTDGILAYEGTATIYRLTNLIAGTTYYFSSWGESGGAYSTTYKTGVTTTLGYAISTGDDFQPVVPFVNWLQSTDYTRLSNLDPLYSAINGVADSFGTPRNTAWQFVVLFMIAIAGVAVMLKSGYAAGLIVGILMVGAGVSIHVLPGWMVFVAILFGFGFWFIEQKRVSA